MVYGIQFSLLGLNNNNNNNNNNGTTSAAIATAPLAQLGMLLLIPQLLLIQLEPPALMAVLLILELL